jgi:hypothetical protein
MVVGSAAKIGHGILGIYSPFVICLHCIDQAGEG